MKPTLSSRLLHRRRRLLRGFALKLFIRACSSGDGSFIHLAASLCNSLAADTASRSLTSFADEPGACMPSARRRCALRLSPTFAFMPENEDLGAGLEVARLLLACPGCTRAGCMWTWIFESIPMGGWALCMSRCEGATLGTDPLAAAKLLECQCQ